MFSHIAIIALVAAGAQAVSIRDATDGNTIVSPDTACAVHTDAATCNAVNFCKWDNDDCEADDDFVESINDAACVNYTTKPACELDAACDWQDTYCEGDDNALSVITNADGSVTAAMTGVTVPASGTFQDAGKYCANAYADEAACASDQKCNWYSGVYGGVAGCQSNQNEIQTENQVVCVELTTIAQCAADMRCDYNDGTCEANNDIIVA